MTCAVVLSSFRDGVTSNVGAQGSHDSRPSRDDCSDKIRDDPGACLRSAARSKTTGRITVRLDRTTALESFLPVRHTENGSSGDCQRRSVKTIKTPLSFCRRGTTNGHGLRYTYHYFQRAIVLFITRNNRGNTKQLVCLRVEI